MKPGIYTLFWSSSLLILTEFLLRRSDPSGSLVILSYAFSDPYLWLSMSRA